MEDSQSSSQNKADNTNFTVKENDSQEVFTCNICQKEAKAAKAIKHHITSKHRERPADSEDDDPDGKKSKDDAGVIDDIDDDELAEWANKENGGGDSIQQEEEMTSPSQQNNELNSTTEKMVIDSAYETEGTISEAVERIKYLEGENKTQEELIKSLELQMETKNDLLNLANVKAESLEIEIVNKNTRINTLAAAYKNMKVEMNKMKEENGGGTNRDIAKKLKKATDDLKVKSKLLEESEKAKEELNIKVGKEMSLRAKAEGDTEMLQNCVKALQSVVDKQNTKENNKDKSKDRCTFLDKPGGCKKGSKCNFWHPEGDVPRAGRPDCSFWMNGFCKYEAAECSKEHDPFKKGTKTRNKKDEGASFAESLVQALGQVSSVEAARSSSQGLDGQNVLSLIQRAIQPTLHTPPPPFPTAGRITQISQQAGSSSDPAQQILQALLALAERK